MRASDVIIQLAILLPQLTDKFTDSVGVVSLTRSGLVITVQCKDVHNLEVGDGVAITGAEMHVPIATLTRSGVIGTLVTSRDHDLTNAIATSITISGATESEFNGTFVRTNIENRRTITFVIEDAGATSATGSPVLENAESALRQYNNTYRVESTPSSTVFTFAHSVSGLSNPVGTIVARVKPRISGAIEADRAIKAYTRKNPNKYWLFVIIEDVAASKSRNIDSDATENLGRGSEYRQQIIQPFTVYVIIPTADELVAREARDIADDLLRSICRSLLFSKFDSGLYVGSQGTVSFISHGVYKYDTALYVHSYFFHQVVDLTFEDTVGPDLDVAFRTLEFTIDPDLGTGTLTGIVDLDDTPL